MERRWKLFKTATRNLELLTESNGIRLNLMQAAVDFGSQNGITVSHNPEDLKYVDVTRKFVNRSKRLIDAVELEELALRFTHNDIDIMAPPGTTSDEIAQYQSLDFFIVATITYVVVWSSIYAATTYALDHSEKLATTNNNQIYKNDMNFGTHKDPQIRQRWKEMKKEKDFQPKKSIIGDLMDGIQGLGDFMKKKAGMGLVIAVPVIAALLFLSLRGRK